MGNNARGKARVIAWPCMSHPAYDRVSVGFKLVKGGLQKSGPGPQPVVRSKDMPQASDPSQAPLPSSDRGKPQPPARNSRPPAIPHPTLPVPTTMMPPSRLGCAPKHAARASLVKIAWQKGSGDDCARKRVEGSHAPAKARQAMILSSCPSRSACFKQSPVALNNDVRLS
jgi:hypothetical protein